MYKSKTIDLASFAHGVAVSHRERMQFVAQVCVPECTKMSDCMLVRSGMEDMCKGPVRLACAYAGYDWEWESELECLLAPPMEERSPPPSSFFSSAPQEGGSPSSTPSYREIHGDIFTSDAEALVNTVNCIGIMGKGIALEFERRYPDLYSAYRAARSRGELSPGKVWTYRTKDNRIVFNCAVKDSWRDPSRIEWVTSCLNELVQLCRANNVKSLALPWMGAMNGRIPVEQIKAVTREVLSGITDINISVYEIRAAQACHELKMEERSPPPSSFPTNGRTPKPAWVDPRIKEQESWKLINPDKYPGIERSHWEPPKLTPGAGWAETISGKFKPLPPAPTMETFSLYRVPQKPGFVPTVNRQKGALPDFWINRPSAALAVFRDNSRYLGYYDADSVQIAIDEGIRVQKWEYRAYKEDPNTSRFIYVGDDNMIRESELECKTESEDDLGPDDLYVSPHQEARERSDRNAVGFVPAFIFGSSKPAWRQVIADGNDRHHSPYLKWVKYPSIRPIGCRVEIRNGYVLPVGKVGSITRIKTRADKKRALEFNAIKQELKPFVGVERAGKMAAQQVAAMATC